MNYSDSERIASVLESAGYQKTLSEDKADLIVINACSVRKSAVDRIAGNFKKYKKYKKKNPKLKTVLTGCVLESDKNRFEKLFDLVIDIKEIERLMPRLKFLLNNEDLPVFKPPQPPLSGGLSSSPDKGRLGGVLNSTKPQRTQKDSDLDYFNILPQYQSKFTAYVPIMTGCNNFCSYCVVPYTRGREYSRPVEEILNEITELVEKGYREIILLGQNVNSYKSRIKNQELLTANNSTIEQFNNRTINFSKLLKLINNIPGNFWIRFLTSHPKDMTEELIKTVAECEKATPYIHLALQSGDDEILKKMNRKYTAEHFLNLIKLIRKYIPDAAITTDVIVGFPSETEKQFQNTAEVMKKAKFDMAYINKYSPRAGTESAKLDDDVSWEEKKEREKILTEILKETAIENNKKYVGKVVEVLIDKTDDNYIYGKTRSFKNVKAIAGSIVSAELWNRNAGEFVKIKIIQADSWGLEGEIKE